jgi:prepilin-type N-terminal cleavage/methylation domain-containing protein
MTTTIPAGRGRTSVERWRGGYTLIELIVAVGLFAIVMTLATGAYLVMIGVNRQTQALATGINNLSFVLESMTTAMRTGTQFQCNGSVNDCLNGTGTSFTFVDQKGTQVTYGRSTAPATCGTTAGCVVRTAGTSSAAPLTDPSVIIKSLRFSASGMRSESDGDTTHSQPYVTISVYGTVNVGPGKVQDFFVESSAAMRGTDL